MTGGRRQGQGGTRQSTRHGRNRTGEQQSENETRNTPLTSPTVDVTESAEMKWLDALRKITLSPTPALPPSLVPMVPKKKLTKLKNSLAEHLFLWALTTQSSVMELDCATLVDTSGPARHLSV
jgi:hypothetical protein